MPADDAAERLHRLARLAESVDAVTARGSARRARVDELRQIYAAASADFNTFSGKSSAAGPCPRTARSMDRQSDRRPRRLRRGRGPLGCGPTYAWHWSAATTYSLLHSLVPGSRRAAWTNQPTTLERETQSKLRRDVDDLGRATRIDDRGGGRRIGPGSVPQRLAQPAVPVAGACLEDVDPTDPNRWRDPGRKPDSASCKTPERARRLARTRTSSGPKPERRASESIDSARLIWQAAANRASARGLHPRRQPALKLGRPWNGHKVRQPRRPRHLGDHDDAPMRAG